MKNIDFRIFRMRIFKTKETKLLPHWKWQFECICAHFRGIINSIAHNRIRECESERRDIQNYEIHNFAEFFHNSMGFDVD